MGWLDCGLGALQAFYTGYAFNPLSQLPLASGLSRVWVCSLIVPPKATGCKMHSVHSLGLPHPSLGTFLQERSYRPLGKRSVQMRGKGASD